MCYVARQLVAFDCAGHAHALRYRDSVAPRATALLERLSRVGGCCCDCELFMNGYQLDPRLWTSSRTKEDADVFFMEMTEPDDLPVCAGVRRGSVTPCRNWQRIYRGYR